MESRKKVSKVSFGNGKNTRVEKSNSRISDSSRVSRELFQRDKKLLSSRSGMMLKTAANGIIFRLRFGGISSPSWCRKMCKFREIPFPEITGKSTPVLSERPRCEQISRSCFFRNIVNFPRGLHFDGYTLIVMDKTLLV